MHRLLVALKSVQSLIWINKQCLYIDNYDVKVLGFYMNAFWTYFHLSQIKETNLFVLNDNDVVLYLNCETLKLERLGSLKHWRRIITTIFI